MDKSTTSAIQCALARQSLLARFSRCAFGAPEVSVQRATARRADRLGAADYTVSFLVVAALAACNDEALRTRDGGLIDAEITVARDVAVLDDARASDAGPNDDSRVVDARPSDTRADTLLTDAPVTDLRPIDEDARLPELQVVIMAGQSNMVGLGLNRELTGETATTLNSVRIYYNSGTHPTSNALSWRSLSPGFGVNENRFGPEVGLAHRLRQRWPQRRIALIKVAQGSTALSDAWRARSGPIYQRLIAEVRRQLDVLSQHWRPRLAGLVWMQGESDAANEANAIAYQQRLTDFVNAVRADLGHARLPVVAGLISRRESWPHAHHVRSAVIAVATAMPPMHVVEADDLPRHANDPAHYNSAGTLALGRRLADALADFDVSTASIASFGPVEVTSNTDVEREIGRFADASMATFTRDGQRYWLVAGWGGTSSLGTGTVDAPFSATRWRFRPQDVLYVNPRRIDVSKNTGVFPGHAWVVNTYQHVDGILAIVHVESFVWDDISYQTDGTQYCQLARPTRMPHVPAFGRLPVSQTNAGACAAPTTLSAGAFIVGGQRYYSNGSSGYCRYPDSGLQHGVRIVSDLPTAMSNGGSCSPQAAASVVPAGVFNVANQSTYRSDGSAYCRYRRTTVMAGVRNYASLPTAMVDRGDCALPTSSATGAFIVGGHRYVYDGSSSFCLAEQQNDATSAVPILPDFPSSLQHAGKCAVAPRPAEPTANFRGVFNVRATTTRWAGRLGLAWSEDGGDTWRYLGHIITPHSDPDGRNSMNVHGAPYLVRDGYLYVYYVDHYCASSETTCDCGQGGCRPRKAVARAPLSGVIADAKSGRVGTWRKYYRGSYNQPGHGGRLTPLPVTGILHTDAAYSAHTGKYYLSASFRSDQYGNDGYIKLYESRDLVSWSEVHRVHFEPSSAATELPYGYQYVTITNVDGSDNGRVGRWFYVYSFFRDSGQENSAVGHRWLVDLGAN